MFDTRERESREDLPETVVTAQCCQESEERKRGITG